MLIEPAELEPLTEQIIGCAMTVHEQTGPGLLESVYQSCLALELQAQDLLVETKRDVPLVFRGVSFPRAYEIDILVEGKVIVEVKSVATLAWVHEAQVITYLKLMNCSIGLLINFNVGLLKWGLRRVLHPEIYAKTRRGVNPPK